MSFVIGWLTDRWGVRRLVLISQVGLGLSFLGLATVSALGFFYFVYFMMGLAAAGTLMITFTKAVSAHFIARRGLALGIVLSGTGLCGALVPPYVSALEDAFGWRGAYVGLGLLPLFIALPAAMYWLREPAAVSRDGALAPTTPEATRAGIRRALRDYRYWLIVVVFTLGAAAAAGFITSMVPVLVSLGHDSRQAAGLASVFGAAVVAGRLTVGALLDRIWAPYVATVFLFPAATVLALWSAGLVPTGLTVPALIVVGLATGSEYDIAAYLTARYFGVMHYGKLFSGVYVGTAIGSGVAASLYGMIFDASGNYTGALLASAAAFAAGPPLLLTLGRYPRVADKLSL
jgi:MFS family permease